MLEQFLEITNSSDSSRSKLDYLLALKEVDAKLKISLALFCAEDCFILIDKAVNPELWDKANLCLALVRNYLIDEAQVSLEELNQAGNLTYAAALAASNAAYESSDRSAAVQAAFAAAHAAYTAAHAEQWDAAAGALCAAVANALIDAVSAAGYGSSFAASTAAVLKTGTTLTYEDREAIREAAYEKYYNYMADLILVTYFPDKKAAKLLYF